MFVYNFKLVKSQKLFVFFAAASIMVAVICIICMISVQNKLPDTATCDELGSYSLKYEDTDEQCRFLEQLGLTADGIIDKVNVVIPVEFNRTYEEYNELQKKIGLDLEKFRGKTAEKITYKLKNAISKYAVLLIYKGYVIGGHLTDGEYGSENMPLI